MKGEDKKKQQRKEANIYYIGINHLFFIVEMRLVDF